MNYILYTDNTFMHFFHSPSEGLCLKEKKKGRWSEPEIIYREALDGFSVYSDSKGLIHILCADKKGAIFYITKKDEEWKCFTLSGENPDILPIEFKIAKAGNIINFFYTAEYKRSYILVHCVLGKNAKPEILDTLYHNSPAFSVSSDKVYYTNQDKVLGFCNFSDSKPALFSKIAENATDCYAVNFCDKEYTLYKKDSFIVLNGTEIFSDPLAEKPLISVMDNKLTVQWKSNNFVRYLTSFNNGVTWSAPMRFIGSGEKICEFCILNHGEPHICYGQNLKPDPVIYGKSNLFFIF